jgi:ribonuclease III family protein
MLFNKIFMEGTDQIDKIRLVKDMPLKNLAHLGDVVFELFEREYETVSAVSVEHLHKQVVARVNSHEQARLLTALKPLLTEAELDIVRRARNLKPGSFRRNVEQAVLRQATAFEALIGYLYLLDEDRLQDLLNKTRPE